MARIRARTSMSRTTWDSCSGSAGPSPATRVPSLPRAPGDESRPAPACPRALVAGQLLLWPTGPTRRVAGRLGGLHCHGLQILRTEEADQDALAAVIPGDSRNDRDLGALIPRGVPVTSGGICRRVPGAPVRWLVRRLESRAGCGRRFTRLQRRGARLPAG